MHTCFTGGSADAHQRMQPQLHRLQFARRGRRVVEHRIDLRVDAHETRQDRRELAVQIQQTFKHNDAAATAPTDVRRLPQSAKALSKLRMCSIGLPSYAVSTAVLSTALGY